MAKSKKNDFDFTNSQYFDVGALSSLFDASSAIAPTHEEVDIVQKAEGDVITIPTSQLNEYHSHTYKVIDNDDMEALVDSIKDIGIILPLLVRKIDSDSYEVISGHRRLFAANKLKLEEVPCKIIEVDDATADIMMVDTNLHREEISPSEKARSYEVRIAAMRAKGLLKDEGDSDRKYEEQLADDISSSRVSVYRYRKLLQLIPDLLSMVDSKDIPVVAGAKIASLDEDKQHIIYLALNETGKPLTVDTANKLVTAAEARTVDFTVERAVDIIDGKVKPRTKSGSPTLVKAKEVKEKDFRDALPDAIASLSPKEKAAFLKTCIQCYIDSNNSWNDVPLK